MPVPVAVTHPNGRGIVAATPSALETEGPFARLTKQKAAVVAEVSVHQPMQKQDKVNGASVQQEPVDTITTDSRASVVVDGLDFSYPGLGEFRWWKQQCILATEPSAGTPGPTSRQTHHYILGT
jgi:hypothetical protein